MAHDTRVLYQIDTRTRKAYINYNAIKSHVLAKRLTDEDETTMKEVTVYLNGFCGYSSQGPRPISGGVGASKIYASPGVSSYLRQLFRRDVASLPWPASSLSAQPVYNDMPPRLIFSESCKNSSARTTVFPFCTARWPPSKSFIYAPFSLH